jgi:hypothetical protein
LDRLLEIFRDVVDPLAAASIAILSRRTSSFDSFQDDTALCALEVRYKFGTTEGRKNGPLAPQRHQMKHLDFLILLLESRWSTRCTQASSVAEARGIAQRSGCLQADFITLILSPEELDAMIDSGGVAASISAKSFT